MRTTIMLSVGAGVLIAGFLIRHLRRKAWRADAGSVSGQWIAEHSSRTDGSWM